MRNYLFSCFCYKKTTFFSSSDYIQNECEISHDSTKSTSYYMDLGTRWILLMRKIRSKKSHAMYIEGCYCMATEVAMEMS
jgi:hypothetical protein